MFERQVMFAALLTASFLATPFAVAGSWHFNKAIGLDGQAYVTDTGDYRLEIECGNGGGPSLMLSAPTLANGPLGRAPKQTSITFDIDGRPFDEPFECHPGGTSCGNYGIPATPLITALRQGTDLVVRYQTEPVATFSLVGSNAALSRLSACIEP